MTSLLDKYGITISRFLQTDFYGPIEFVKIEFDTIYKET